VDVNGNVLNRFAYTPYGVVETLNPNWTPTASPSIPWAVLFRGYFADEGTGLLHARARQYSPTLGRFVGRDPKGYVNETGLYGAYFVPNYFDPSGTQFQDRATRRISHPPTSEEASYAEVVVRFRIDATCNPCFEHRSSDYCFKAKLLEFVVVVVDAWVYTQWYNIWSGWDGLPKGRFNRTEANIQRSIDHEQTHKDAYRRWHDTEIANAQRELNTECIFDNREECERYVAERKRHYERSFFAEHFAQFQHRGPFWPNGHEPVRENGDPIDPNDLDNPPVLDLSILDEVIP
jgi:RHS repeat-associated protein